MLAHPYPEKTRTKLKVVICSHQTDSPLREGARCLVWCFTMLEWKDAIHGTEHFTNAKPHSTTQPNFIMFRICASMEIFIEIFVPTHCIIRLFQHIYHRHISVSQFFYDTRISTLLKRYLILNIDFKYCL